MHLILFFFKPLPEVLGVEKNIEIEMNDGATINDLVTKMIERYGEKFKNFLADYRDKRAIVLLNGKYTDLETKLADGNKLFFMLPYCGG